ncbi:MAG: 3'-5' exonuclease, partial [Geminicoccaceae bacterium]
LARRAELPLLQAARQMVETDELATRTKNALVAFLGLLDGWRTVLAEAPPRELAEQILDESGYTAMWQNDRSPDAPGRLDNLKELVKAIEEFPTLAAFLEHVSLVMDAVGESGTEQVSVMTLHGAKGLEFNSVFLAGWEDGLFPNQRALDEGGGKALEEERRLAYVGLTRARQRCTVSFAANRRIYNQWSSSVPSRFIEELPAEHVEHLHRNPAMRPDAESFMDDLLVPQVARFRSRRAELGKVIEGRAEILTTPPSAGASFSIGDRIFHQKFGYGRVAAVDGNKLEIAFEKSGVKKVISSFVEAA